MRWILLVLLLPLCYGLDYYASPTGTETDCSSMQNSKNPGSIADALGCINGAGHSVRLLPGTYQGINLENTASGTVGNENVLRSDDGNGNYARDQVIVTGTTTLSSKVFVNGVSHWKVEQLTVQVNGDAQYGILVYHLSQTNSNIQTIGNRITGNMQSAEEQDGAIIYINSDDVLIDGNIIDVTGSTAMIEVNSDTSFRDTTGGQVKNNEISGVASQYAIGFKRHWDAEIYNNYIHDFSVGQDYADSIFFIRHGGDLAFYNNVIKRGSGSFQSLMNVRGMSTGGNPPGAVRVIASHNTFDLDGGGFSYALFGGDNTEDNQFNNNLVIDCSGGTLYDEWSGYGATNNIISGNKFECDVDMTYGGGSVDGGGNENNVNVQTSGSEPQYLLDASLDGVAFTGMPTTDYIGNARANPPDAGAFEYGGSAPPACAGTCCQVGQTCSGNIVSASDCSTCCIGTCEIIQPPVTDIYWSTDVPLNLEGTAPQQSTAYIELPSTPMSASLILRLFDADTIGEGRIQINGNEIALPVIPNPDSLCNYADCWFNNTVLNPSWLVTGQNEIVFFHDATAGFNVVQVGISSEGINLSQLIDVIEDWKTGSLTINQVMEAIKSWKNS